MPHVPGESQQGQTPQAEGEETPRTLAEQEDDNEVPDRMRLTPKRISMRAFDVAPQTIFKQLFGREAVVDERSGEMTYYPDPALDKPANPGNNAGLR